MDFHDYLRHDATSLAALVAARQVTPRELLDTALARHAQVHGRINAVVRLMEHEARRQQLEGAQPWFDRLPAMTREDVPARELAGTTLAG